MFAVSHSVRTTALALAATLLLSACVPLVVGGAVGGTALIATDRRTIGTQVEDKNIGLKVNNRLPRELGETVRVDATSFMGRVLLLGEAPDEATRTRAAELAAQVENVTQVVNQMRIAPVAAFEARARNAWLASKVRTALINTRGVPSRAMTIAANDGVVYLMGRVTRSEGDMAAVVASEISGVKQVVKVFHILSPDEARVLGVTGASSGASNSATQPAQPVPVTALEAGADAAPADNAAPPSVEIMPVQ